MNPSSGKKAAKITFQPSELYGLTEDVQIQDVPSVEVATRFGISPSLYSEVSVQKIIAREMLVPKANAWALTGQTPEEIRAFSSPVKAQVVDVSSPIYGHAITPVQRFEPPAMPESGAHPTG